MALALWAERASFFGEGLPDPALQPCLLERLSAIEELMTQKEAQRALELSQKVEAGLKPIVYNIVLQGPEKA